MDPSPWSQARVGLGERYGIIIIIIIMGMIMRAWRRCLMTGSLDDQD